MPELRCASKRFGSSTPQASNIDPGASAKPRKSGWIPNLAAGVDIRGWIYRGLGEPPALAIATPLAIPGRHKIVVRSPGKNGGNPEISPALN